MSYTYIDAASHGFSSGDPITFSNLDGGQGIVAGQVYYVIAAGLTTDIFQFSETLGGSAFAFDTLIAAGNVSAWPTYSTATGIMSPPGTPATPTGLALTSIVALDADGHAGVRLDLTIDPASDPQTRSTWVTVQGPTGQPVVVSFAPDETHASIPGVTGGVQYSATAIAYDVYGNASAATSAVVHTASVDTTPPAQVTGLAAFGAILGLISTWDQSAASDLSHYEVQVDDNNSFTSPDTYKIRANVLALQQIAAGTWYFRVRAVDLSGNAGTYSSTVSATSRTVQTADLADALITTAKLVAGSVTDVALASAAVTASKIALDAVTASAIAAGAVGTSELDALAVTTAKLAAGAVDTAALAATAVTTAKIAADAVTAAEIAAGAVGSSELAAGAVIAGKITAGTIVAGDIAAGTITGAKIAAGTITASNLVADTITANEIAAGAVTASELGALAVTTAKLDAGAVTAAKITAATITSNEIAALTIVAANIAAGTITAAKIAAGTITATEIAALTIVASNIAAGTITGAKIAASTITASNLAADTITANEIAAGAITSSELAANAVVAGKIAAGTIATADLNASCSIQLVSNSGATVVINSSGITITNGKLTMQDENGASVLGATGFSGAWSAFIALGLYNAQFGAGTAGAVVAGRTSALPYWTVSQPDGASGALTYEAGPPPDVKATWGAIGKRWQLDSDKVPVNANRYYEFGTYVTVNAPTTVEVDVRIELFWWKADGTASAITPTVGPFSSAFIGGLTSVSRQASGAIAPSDAAFASVMVSAKEATTHDAAAYCKFLLAWLTVTSQNFTDLTTGNLSTGTISSNGNTVIFGPTEVFGDLSLGLVSAGATSTGDGNMKWNDTQKVVEVGDTTRAKPVTPLGFVHQVFPYGATAADAMATILSLAAVSAGSGGAIAVMFVVPTPIILGSYRLRNLDTASLRTAEARLFYSKADASASLTYFPGSAAAWSFTPSVASNRDAALTGGDILLPAGSYWFVLRNTSTSQTFGLGRTTHAGPMTFRTNYQKAIAALTTTLDIVTGWGAASASAGVLLLGRLPDGSTLADA